MRILPGSSASAYHSWGEGRPVLGYDNIEKNVRCYQSQQLVGGVVYPTISIVSRYSLRRCRQLVDPCCYHLYSRLYFQLRALQIEGKRSTTAVSIARPVPATSPTGAPMENNKSTHRSQTSIDAT